MIATWDVHIRLVPSPLPVANRFSEGLRPTDMTDSSWRVGYEKNKRTNTCICVALEHELDDCRARITELHSTVLRTGYDPPTVVRHYNIKDVVLDHTYLYVTNRTLEIDGAIPCVQGSSPYTRSTPRHPVGRQEEALYEDHVWVHSPVISQRPNTRASCPEPHHHRECSECDAVNTVLVPSRALDQLTSCYISNPYGVV
jgi:hypothetical protein